MIWKYLALFGVGISTILMATSACQKPSGVTQESVIVSDDPTDPLADSQAEPAVNTTEQTPNTPTQPSIEKSVGHQPKAAHSELRPADEVERIRETAQHPPSAGEIDTVQPGQPTTDQQATDHHGKAGQPKTKLGTAIRELNQIDEALAQLNQKTVEDPSTPKPVEPMEVHEALRPLIEETWTRLHPGYEAWLDMKNKQVIVGGRICLRDGPLEMFACPEGTKEHESIVATRSNARIIHTGLLAVGAVAGTPVQWEPEHVPAQGPVVNVTVVWTADGERKQRLAQEMILDRTTGERLKHQWVFCGSGQWRDPDTGHVEYFADSGDMICVSNFMTAMMDLTIESSALNAGLRFNALTAKIPALHTPVLLILKPDLTSAEDKAEEESAEDKTDG